MSYQLNPDQVRGIAAADIVCRANGLPTYYELLKALAGLVVAARDDMPLGPPLERAAATLEKLRNDSAAPKETTDAQLQAALKRLAR